MYQFQHQSSPDVRSVPRRASSADRRGGRVLHAATAGFAFLFVTALVLGLIS